MRILNCRRGPDHQELPDAPQPVKAVLGKESPSGAWQTAGVSGLLVGNEPSHVLKLCGGWRSRGPVSHRMIRAQRGGGARTDKARARGFGEAPIGVGGQPAERAAQHSVRRRDSPLLPVGRGCRRPAIGKGPSGVYCSYRYSLASARSSNSAGNRCRLSPPAGQRGTGCVGYPLPALSYCTPAPSRAR